VTASSQRPASRNAWVSAPCATSEGVRIIGLLGFGERAIGHQPYQLGRGLVGDIEISQAVYPGEHSTGRTPFPAVYGPHRALDVSDEIGQQRTHRRSMVRAAVAHVPCLIQPHPQMPNIHRPGIRGEVVAGECSLHRGQCHVGFADENLHGHLVALSG
jgi:hypothetical protein